MKTDLTILKKTLIDYTKAQLLRNKRDGVVIHFDGTLMSLVNVALLDNLKPFATKVVVYVVNQNKFYLSQLALMLNNLNISYEVKDLTHDFETISQYANNKQGDVKLEIALRKRLVDMALNIEVDKHNLLVVGNLCKSQWVIDFPHRNYKNLEHLFLLGSLWYDQVQDLAQRLNLPEQIVNREPSHYLYGNQNDLVALGFSYDDLKDFYSRKQDGIKKFSDKVIADRLLNENYINYMVPYFNH